MTSRILDVAKRFWYVGIVYYGLSPTLSNEEDMRKFVESEYVRAVFEVGKEVRGGGGEMVLRTVTNMVSSEALRKLFEPIGNMVASRPLLIPLMFAVFWLPNVTSVSDVIRPLKEIILEIEKKGGRVMCKTDVAIPEGRKILKLNKVCKELSFKGLSEKTEAAFKKIEEMQTRLPRPIFTLTADGAREIVSTSLGPNSNIESILNEISASLSSQERENFVFSVKGKFNVLLEFDTEKETAKVTEVEKKTTAVDVVDNMTDEQVEDVFGRITTEHFSQLRDRKENKREAVKDFVRRKGFNVGDKEKKWCEIMNIIYVHTKNVLYAFSYEHRIYAAIYSLKAFISSGHVTLPIVKCIFRLCQHSQFVRFMNDLSPVLEYEENAPKKKEQTSLPLKTESAQNTPIPPKKNESAQQTSLPLKTKNTQNMPIPPKKNEQTSLPLKTENDPKPPKKTEQTSLPLKTKSAPKQSTLARVNARSKRKGDGDGNSRASKKAKVNNKTMKIRQLEDTSTDNTVKRQRIE